MVKKLMLPYRMSSNTQTTFPPSTAAEKISAQTERISLESISAEICCVISSSQNKSCDLDPFQCGCGWVPAWRGGQHGWYNSSPWLRHAECHLLQAGHPRHLQHFQFVIFIQIITVLSVLILIIVWKFSFFLTKIFQNGHCRWILGTGGSIFD